MAVCDTPAGKYEFMHDVTRAGGSRPNIGRWFDPAILSEESGNYLYYGFCPPARFPGMGTLEIPGGGALALPEKMPYITQEPSEDGEHGMRPFICNLREGAVCGFKYFDFGKGVPSVALTVRGEGTIALVSGPEGTVLSETAFTSPGWTDVFLRAEGLAGVQPLYFRRISGKGDLAAFKFYNM